MLGDDVERRATAGDLRSIPEVDDESHVGFITGFPCSRTTCHGTLIEGVYAGEDAIVCSVCEHVYYLVTDEG